MVLLFISFQTKYFVPCICPNPNHLTCMILQCTIHLSFQTSTHQPGESVAILGGDSDLVLMGLVVPPEVTHNIHIILPGERQKSLVVSIWETTRMLARMIEGTASYGGGKKSINKLNGKKSNKSPLSLGETKRARLDMVLLVLLNGNDYLPRIRGCGGGFDVFFHVYLHVVKRWKNRVKHGDDAIDEMHPFLINIDDNNELSINVPFALTFFRQLLNHSQDPADFEEPNEDSSPYQSNLGVLNNLIEAKFLPGPMDFQVLNPTSNTQLSMVDNFESELWQMNSELSQNTSTIMDEVFGDGGVEIVRMTLGHFPEDVYTSHVSGSSNSDIDTDSHEVVTTLLGASDGHGVISRMIQKEGGRSYLFEVPHRIGNSIKHAKRRLACLAVEEIFGKENMGK